MKYIITESQYKKLLSEQSKGKEIEGCGVFGDMNNREFCKVVEKEISSNLSEYSPQMEGLLKKYFTSDDRISQIQMEQLNNESDIVKEDIVKEAPKKGRKKVETIIEEKEKEVIIPPPPTVIEETSTSQRKSTRNTKKGGKKYKKRTKKYKKRKSTITKKSNRHSKF